MGGPWLPSATAFFNIFLMASLKVGCSGACSGALQRQKDSRRTFFRS